MKYIKLFELFSLNDKYPIVLNETFDYGNVLAVIHNNMNYVRNALNKYGNCDKILNLLENKKILPVGILKNINVEEEYRNKGYGNDLFEIYENWLYDNDVKYSIIVSDSLEKQQEGFILDKWYENFNYKNIGNISNNSVFLKEL